MKSITLDYSKTLDFLTEEEILNLSGQVAVLTGAGGGIGRNFPASKRPLKRLKAILKRWL